MEVTGISVIEQDSNMEPISHSALPTFLVADVEATVELYVDELGFTVDGAFRKDPPYAYANLRICGAEIMVCRCPAM